MAVVVSLVIAVVITQALHIPPGTPTWITTGIVYLAIYGASLVLKPWTKCPKCKGDSRNHGLLFTKAWSHCARCDGSGKVIRWGRRMLGFSPPMR